MLGAVIIIGAFFLFCILIPGLWGNLERKEDEKRFKRKLISHGYSEARADEIVKKK